MFSKPSLAVMVKSQMARYHEFRQLFDEQGLKYKSYHRTSSHHTSFFRNDYGIREVYVTKIYGLKIREEVI